MAEVTYSARSARSVSTLYVCSGCGAVVLDRTMHSAWHAAQVSGAVPAGVPVLRLNQ